MATPNQVSSESSIKAELNELFSHVGHVEHNYRHLLYGPFNTLPEPYRAEAYHACVDHRLRTSRHRITAEQAARDIDQEWRSPERRSIYGTFKVMERLGHTVSPEIRQRFAALISDHPAAKPTKPKLDEIFDDAADKARAISDLRQMDKRDSSGSSPRDFLQLLFKESQTGYSLRTDSNVPGCAIEKTLYVTSKEMGHLKKAFAASSAFAHNSTIYVPVLSPHDLTNRWRDATTKKPVEMSNQELHIHNCSNVQTITTHAKLFLPGLKTQGLAHPIGEVVDSSLLVVVEGWATGMTVHEAIGYPVLCAMSSTNLLNVVAAVREANLCARVLVIGDSGTESTLEKIRKAVEASGDSTNWIATATVPGPSNYDLNDMFIDGLELGLDKVRDFVEDLVERFHELNNPAPAEQFIVSASELSADNSKVSYLLEGIIPEASIGAIVGETGVGKSFLTIGMAACIASGKSHHGRQTNPVNVLYVAGEGHSGYKSRIEAWQDANGCRLSEELYLTRGAVDISNTIELEPISQFCQEHDVGLVVFDTLHRCFSGDENSAKDIGNALQNLGKSFTEKGIAILLVHHTGHSASNRGRGSSSLRAAFDWELLIEKTETGLTVTPAKIKEGELFPAESFVMVKQCSSLVLQKTISGRRALRLDRKQETILNALKSLGESFSRQQAEDVTFDLIDSRKKGQTLGRFLDKLLNTGWLVFTENQYRFVG